MKLEIEITRQDYVDFNVYHFLKARLTNAIMVGTTGLIFLQFIFNKDKTAIHLDVLIVSSLLYIIFYALILYYSLDRTRKIPDDKGPTLGKKELEFTTEYFRCKDKDSMCQYNWTVIKNMGESKKAYYLFIDANMAIIIPKRYFPDKNQEKEFSVHILKNLTHVQNG
jgi:YcxB-like protein